MSNKSFSSDDPGIAIDADLNRYYVALINEAHSERERIELGRAATETMRARLAGRGTAAARGMRRFAALVTG